jgi:hypothetical protein
MVVLRNVASPYATRVFDLSTQADLLWWAEVITSQ